MTSSSARGALPHELEDLRAFTLDRVINDGRDAHGRVVALGTFEGEQAQSLVKLNRAPLPSSTDAVRALLREVTSMRTRMPYSGGEYGYYVSRDVEIEVIAPSALTEATEAARDKLLKKHIARSSTQRLVCARETPDMYTTKHEAQYIAGIPKEATNWVREILSFRAEKERLLHADEHFVMNTDPKWTTHPDCETTDRKSWRDHPSVVDLYCLGIYAKDDLRSLRDVRAEHLPALRALLHRGREVIERVYGVKAEEIRVYVHYPPQFYHFHVHYQALSAKETTGSSCERAILLEDIIDNVERDGDHYANANLSLKMGDRDNLYRLFFGDDANS